MKPRSVNSHLRNLKALFRWLLGKKYITEDIFFNLKELKIVDTNKDNQYIEFEESRKMVNASKNLRDKVILATYLSLGLRRAELIDLKINSYNNGILTVIGKGNKVRELGVEPNLRNILEQYITERNASNPNDYLFISNKGSKFSGTGIYFKVKSTTKRANLSEKRIKDIHPHTMRHTFGTDLRESCGDIRKVQDAMGHASMQTTMIYDHVRSKIVNEAIINKRSVLSD
jgi:integrase/recombinase XerC